jgi:hypothetical protein
VTCDRYIRRVIFGFSMRCFYESMYAAWDTQIESGEILFRVRKLHDGRYTEARRHCFPDSYFPKIDPTDMGVQIAEELISEIYLSIFNEGHGNP